MVPPSYTPSGLLAVIVNASAAVGAPVIRGAAALALAATCDAGRVHAAAADGVRLSADGAGAARLADGPAVSARAVASAHHVVDHAGGVGRDAGVRVVHRRAAASIVALL